MEFNPDSLFVFQVTPAEALINLLAALFCGILIGFTYKGTYKGVNYSSNYVIAIIMLTMITSLVIMVIGNNLARAFGLVGAMSIIRFRTAVKDTQDIMFIFFALAIGLACGANMYLIAVIGTFFIGATVWIAVEVNAENQRVREYLLQIYAVNQPQENGEMQRILEKFCRKSKLINVKAIGEEERKVMEFSYYVQFRRTAKSAEMIAELNAIPGVTKVNLFFDEN